MKIALARETLLRALQQVIGAIERRQTMPALGNVLINAGDEGLTVTATDLEIELVATVEAYPEVGGATTVSGRKLLEICRALPEGAQVELTAEADRAVVKSGRSRFVLMTLAAAEFPTVGELEEDQRFTLGQASLKRLIDGTAFAMAQQDVRYYLNGLLLELGDGVVRAVATDGHRLAVTRLQHDLGASAPLQVIIPRKGIGELQRMLADGEGEAHMSLSTKHVRVRLPGVQLTSKLIDGRFPDYERVIPSDNDKVIRVDREALRQALVRASILSNEKYRGIRLVAEAGTLKLQAHNPEQEEAEDELEVDYAGDQTEIGFNVAYLLDALGAITTPRVELWLKDANSSGLVVPPEGNDAAYVIMPMRL